MSFDWLTIFFTIPAMLLSSAIHEFAHAYTAYRLGDDTARAEGRMTINPIAHIDPLGFLMMIVGRIGWSKPVPVNSYNFENPVVGNAIVSAAGPISNALLAVISVACIKLLSMIGLSSLIIDIFETFFVVMLYINVSLMLFNLLPVPPLDGSNIIELILPKAWQNPWSSLSQYAPVILFLMVLPFSPLFSFFSTFWYNLLSTVVGWLLWVFGLPVNL